MIDITIKVPPQRLAEFYAMYGEWLEAAPPEEAPQDGELKEWAPGDDDEARYVWSRMSAQARELFQLLPAGPETVAWDELAKALGPEADSSTVGGTFGWPARYAREVGRSHPTKAGETPAGTVYWLEPTVKALFDKVQAESE